MTWICNNRQKEWNTFTRYGLPCDVGYVFVLYNRHEVVQWMNAFNSVSLADAFIHVGDIKETKQNLVELFQKRRLWLSDKMKSQKRC